MNVKIKFTEQSARLAELKQEISRLELKNSELKTEGELRSNSDESDRVRELQDKVADLKAEVSVTKHKKSTNEHRSQSHKLQITLKKHHIITVIAFSKNMKLFNTLKKSQKYQLSPSSLDVIYIINSFLRL